MTKPIQQPTDTQKANEAYNYLLNLGRISVGFARVRRQPRYFDQVNESDVEHSYHLALSATELAASYFPELNLGLVAQFTLVHDLPELYAGDTWSFNLSDEDRAKKEQAEAAGYERLRNELPPYTAILLERYERQEEPEARFVRFVDKVMPAIITFITDEAYQFMESFRIDSLESLAGMRELEKERFQKMFPDFPFIEMIRKIAVEKQDGVVSQKYS